MSGNWVVRIPDLQNKFSLSKGDLGLVLTGGPIGAILIMLLVGNLINKIGSKRMTMLGTLLFQLSLPLLFLMPNPLFQWLALLIFGVGGTIMDVSMNSQGIEVERILKTSTISSFHAFFSIGNIFGAILGGLFIFFRFDPELHLLFVTIIFLPFTLYSFKFLRDVEESKNTKTQKSRIIQFPPRDLWVIGLIVFIASIGEFMISDWGSIYIIGNTGFNSSVAAFGYAIFALFMTIGRLSGDSLSNRFPNDKIVSWFALIGAFGIFLAIATQDLFIILMGFALLGIGLSVIIPLVYKVAGNNSFYEIGSAIAGVALFSYVAGIIEPLFIGQVAEAYSLRVAFLFVAIVTLMIFFMTYKLKSSNSVSKM